jgi:hypothetical protein
LSLKENSDFTVFFLQIYFFWNEFFELIFVKKKAFKSKNGCFHPRIHPPATVVVVAVVVAVVVVVVGVVVVAGEKKNDFLERTYQ